MSTLAELQGPDMEPPVPRPQCCSCEPSHLHAADMPAIRRALGGFQAPLAALALGTGRLDQVRHRLAGEVVQIYERLEADEARLREIAKEVEYCAAPVLCANCGYDG